MAMRLLKLGVLKGFFQRVLPQESAQLIIRPVCIEHPGAICEGREAPVGDCASSAHVDTRSGSEYDARQAAEQVAEPSASNVFASGVLSAVYADSVFRLAANRTIQSWNLPPHALMSKTRLSDCLHSGSAGRSPGTALPRTFHTASPLQRTGRSQLQGALQAQCQSFHDCDLSQSSRGHFEVSARRFYRHLSCHHDLEISRGNVFIAGVCPYPCFWKVALSLLSSIASLNFLPLLTRTTIPLQPTK